MIKSTTESKFKDLIDGEPRREFEFNHADIKLLGHIEVHEQSTLEFFNIYGEWDRFYSIYKLGPMYIHEPHMDDKDRLWFNLDAGVMSITVHKLKSEKIEILKYQLQDGTTIISESKIR